MLCNRTIWLSGSGIALASAMLLLGSHPSTSAPSTLAKKDVVEIRRRVSGCVRMLLWDETRRLSLKNLPEVLDRWLFEQVREIETAPNGQVVVYTWTRRKELPNGNSADQSFTGFGEKFVLVKGTNGWEFADGIQSWGCYPTLLHPR
jgi:hypothetical protein